MKNKDDLLYELIFSDNEDFIINISDYMNPIYNYEDFITEIRKIIIISDVCIIGEGVEVINKGLVDIIWTIKVRR